MRQLPTAIFLALALVGQQASTADEVKVDVAGNWVFETDFDGRAGSSQLVFRQQGNKLTGTVDGGSKLNGTVEGDKIEFRVATFGGKSAYKGTIVDQDHMQGEVDHVIGKGTWTATRGLLQPPATTQAAASNREAERRVKEIARLINSGSVAELKEYAAENFAPIFMTVPMERHVGFILAMHDETRGIDLQSVRDAGPNRAVGLFQSKLTGRPVALEVRVEAEPPYRIVGLGARAPEPSAAAPASEKLSDDEIREALESLMTKLAEADLFSGTVLLARDGVPIFQGAYGVANKDFNVPNRIDTKFNLGSMNKMFTAVAIAQLVERGKLSFDDPLSTFLPEFPDPESAKKIQIKHLLSHTAGLGGYFSKAWQDSSRKLYRTVDDQMKRAAADEKLLFEPGTRHRYSNTGMLVAGKVVEIASGQDYYDYVRENIFLPAGMLNTDSYELDKVNPNLAVGYEKHYDESGISFRNNLFDHVMRGGPQGGGYSTVEDLLRFDVALRSGKLVGPSYVKLLLSAKPELHSPRYGYGFGIEDDGKIAGHGGGFMGINSNLDMFLDSPWTAVVMSNYGQGARVPRQAMRELVRAAASDAAGGEK